MFIARPPRILQWRFKDLLWRMNSDGKDVYLTFDDGPVPEVTPWVLDFLKKHNIKATFFCVGENVSKHKALYDRILSEGHRTGNHTYNHLRFSNDKIDNYLNNIAKASLVINSKLFRPPHGRINSKIIKRLRAKYKIVMWDVLTGDYDRSRTGEMCFASVKKNIRKGSLIVFHDSVKAEKNLKVALPLTVDYLLKQNWNFKTIS